MVGEWRFPVRVHPRSPLTFTIEDTWDYLVGGWVHWAIPRKNDGLRQLGWWHSQYMESHKIHVLNHQPVTISKGGATKKGHVYWFITPGILVRYITNKNHSEIGVIYETNWTLSTGGTTLARYRLTWMMEDWVLGSWWFWKNDQTIITYITINHWTYITYTTIVIRAISQLWGLTTIVLYP